MPTDQRRPFPLSSLLTAQFFGAFNDNAYKMIVIVDGNSNADRWGYCLGFRV